MELSEISLTSSDKVFLDTNILIYALENDQIEGEKARNLLKLLKTKRPKVYTSTLTIQEVLTGVFKQGLEDKIPQYLEFITGDGFIKVFDFDTDKAILAARLRAQYKFKTPDSIQIATALSLSCRLFFTADARLPDLIENMKIVSF